MPQLFVPLYAPRKPFEDNSSALEDEVESVRGTRTVADERASLSEARGS